MSNAKFEDDPVLEELIADLSQQFLDELDLGRTPDVEAFAQQHPQVADIVRGTLGALMEMRSMKFESQHQTTVQDDSHHVPKTLGDYRIIRELGRGGMGVVYEATQISLDRRVALKILPYAAMLDKRALRRFRNEVTAAARLGHPNVVDIYGVACDRGVHHYAMRLIDGLTLGEIITQLRIRRDLRESFPSSISSIRDTTSHQDDGRDIACNDSVDATKINTGVLRADRREPVDEETTRIRETIPMRSIRQPAEHFRSVAELGVAIAEALEHAHQLGVVHRDVKPTNLIIDESGKPWITDFGLAQVETGTALTMTGDLLGTARYMSPEQIMAKRMILDHRTDIYSLGVTLYELLSLELPFDSANRQELFRQILLEPPKPPCKINPAIPKDLETIVLKCIEKDVSDRYPTAQDLADDLSRFVKREPITARRSSLAVKARRWAQRNSAFVSGAISVLMLSLVVMSVALAFLISERGAKAAALNTAKVEQQRAAENFDFALGILQDFVISFADADLGSVPGAESQRQKILRQAAARFDEMVIKNPEGEKLKRRYADVLFKLGDASLGIDDALAENCYKRCIDIGQAQSSDKLSLGEQQEINQQIAYAYRGRAEAIGKTRPQIAEQYFHQAIDTITSRSVSVDQPAVPSSPSADLRFSLAKFLANIQRDNDAIDQFEQAIEVGDDSIRGQSYYQIAKIRFRQERLNDSLVLIEKAIERRGEPGLGKRNYKSLKARILFGMNDLKNAKRASAAALREGHEGLGGVMTKPVADWLIEQFLSDASLAAELGNHTRSFKVLENALGLHTTYYHDHEMLDRTSVETRRNILRELADAQEAVGQLVAAESRREQVAKFDGNLALVPPKHAGITFPLGTAANENLSCVAIDDDGHVYVAGNLSIGTDLQPGYGFRDFDQENGPSVICKYTPEGIVEWSCPLAGNAVALAVDQRKNVFVKGMLSRQSNIKTAQIGDVDIRVPDGDGWIGYLAKTNADGRVQWIRWVPIGSRSLVHFEHSMAVSREGSVVVGGMFHSDFVFNTDPLVILRKRKTDNNSALQGYVARFSTDGRVEWVRSIDADKSAVLGVGFDADGNVILCGNATPIQTAMLGVNADARPFRLGDSSVNSGAAGFLAKLDPDGETLWVRYQVSDGTVLGYDVELGADGEIYYTIKIRNDTDLDGSRDFEDGRDQVELVSDSHWDSSLSCWDADGQLLWNLPLCSGGDGYISAYSLARNSTGGVFVTGRAVCSEINFGGQPFFRYPRSGRDGFIASVGQDGKLTDVWYYTTGAKPSRVVPWSIAANDHGQIAVVGRYRGTVRAPTGEILREMKLWDGFVTIFFATQE